MKAKTVKFPPDIFQSLVDEAARRGIYVNELIREACVYYLTHLRVDRELGPADRNAQLR